MATSARLLAATTRTPGTSRASARFAAATTTVSTLSSAATTAGSAPGTGRKRPSRPSSARNIFPIGDESGNPPAAARIATAIARSNPLPRLGRLAGDNPTVIFVCGQLSPLLTIAARIRSRASRRAVSGRPTKIVAGKPWAISASTSIRWPSTPTSATEYVRASAI